MEKYSFYLKQLWRPKIQPTNEKGIVLSHNEPAFALGGLRRYPNAFSLYEAIANKYNLSIDNILLTCGSEQAIRFAFDAFLNPGDKVVFPWPTFGIVPVFAYYNQAEVVKLYYNRFLKLGNLELPKNTRLFYLANPDNPTGTKYSITEIEAFIKQLPDGYMILDEAYYDYSPTESTFLLRKYKNLIIVRSFSKSYGIPGARVGFAIADAETIDILRKLRPINELPYNSIKVALKALNSNINLKNVQHVKKWQNIFSLVFWRHLQYIDSYANFILLETEYKNFFVEKLLEEHIYVRADFDEPMQNIIRITVGTNKEMRKILRILKKADQIFKEFEI